MYIGTICLRDEGMKRSTLGLGGEMSRSPGGRIGPTCQDDEGITFCSWNIDKVSTVDRRWRMVASKSNFGLQCLDDDFTYYDGNATI